MTWVQNRHRAQYGLVVALMLIAGCTAGTPGAQRWTRTELYLGLTRPQGADITEAEFARFLDEVVTPKFPQGFTVLSAEGRWREDQGRIRTEPSRVLLIVHPNDANTSQAIEQIRGEYKTRFSQEAVLRTDDAQSVSF